MRINLGDKVKDRISGLTGIVIARTEWMYGCVRLTVQPQEMKDGKPVDVQAIDEPQLELLEARAIKDIPNWRESVDEPEPVRRTAAGDRPDVAQRPDAVRR